MNIKIFNYKQDKIYYVMQPKSIRQKQETKTHNEKKNKSIKIDPELTQMLELIEKNF